jgi:hypothetical protein
LSLFVSSRGPFGAVGRQIDYQAMFFLYNAPARLIGNSRIPLDMQSTIAQLEAERNRLDKAIAALRGGNRGKTGNGRRGRHLSASAKKRISDAQKKRWAARKRAGAA